MDCYFEVAKKFRALRNKKKRAKFQQRLDAAKLKTAADATAYQEIHED